MLLLYAFEIVCFMLFIEFCKLYLRTLDIKHQIYRRKRNLRNVPYSSMITICSLSTVVTCVKEVKYGPMVIVYVICFIFFFFFFSCLFLHFNQISIPSTTSPDTGYCQLPCVVLSWHPYFHGTLLWNEILIGFCVYM